MYLKRLVIVSLITLAVAYATGLLFDNIYKKRWFALFFEKSDVLIKDSSHYDVIFLGNSRVHFGINPYYVDSVTGLNTYNFGTGGGDAQDMMLTANVYLMNHPAPKMAIISLDMGALVKNDILKTRYQYLYYLGNDTIRKYMKDAGFLTGLLRMFPFSKYSFFDEYNRTSLFVKGRAYPVFEHNIYKGFLNIHKDINRKVTDLYNIRTGDYQLWGEGILSFHNMVDALHKAGTTVVLVTPPERATSVNRTMQFRKTTDSIFHAIADKYRLKHFNFEDNKYNDVYFVDDIHLNEPGTRIFSIQLADSIKSILP